MSAKISLAKNEAPMPEAAAAKPQPENAPANTSRIDGLTLVIARNSFYTANSQKMIKIFLGQLLVIGTMILVIVKLLDFTDSRDHFFPVQTDNTLILERPLTEPVYSNEQIRSWVENAVTRTMTFGFYDHLMRMQQSRNYFTTAGWASFTSALTSAKTLEFIGAVESATMRPTPKVITAQLRSGDRATITQAGILNGRYSWKVALNIDVVYNTASTQTRSTWKVEVLVTRMQAMESREGIGIEQLIAEKPDQQ